MVCFRLTPKLLVIYCSSERQTWDSLVKAGIALPYVMPLVMLFPFRRKHGCPSSPSLKEAALDYMSASSAVGHSKHSCSFFSFLCFFSSLPIYIYVFLVFLVFFYSTSLEILVQVESFWLLFFFVVFSFHLISYYSLCPNTAALHVIR